MAKKKQATTPSPTSAPLWRRAVRAAGNKYLLTFAVFAVYISFFDHYSLLKRHHLNETLAELERDKLQYERVIEEAENLQRTISADEERFARERYYMRRADEDVFVVE